MLLILQKFSHLLKNSSKLVDPTICRVLDTSPGDTGFLPWIPSTGWRIMSQISLLVCDTCCSLCKSRRITGNHPYSHTNYKVLSKPTELQQQEIRVVILSQWKSKWLLCSKVTGWVSGAHGYPHTHIDRILRSNLLVHPCPQKTWKLLPFLPESWKRKITLWSPAEL